MKFDQSLVTAAQVYYGTPHEHAVRESLMCYIVYADLSELSPEHEPHAREWHGRLRAFVETGNVAHLLPIVETPPTQTAPPAARP